MKVSRFTKWLYDNFFKIKQLTFKVLSLASDMTMKKYQIDNFSTSVTIKCILRYTINSHFTLFISFSWSNTLI